MLILSRRTLESVRLNDDIKITVLAIKGKNVRLGFSAPDDVDIYREEVYELIHEEDQQESDDAEKVA